MERLRGRKLQARRKAFFTLHPLCAHCQERGRTAAATELDHIVPLADGGVDDVSNWQGLCTACHDYKTRRDFGYKLSGACDEDGMPLDPEHGWYE